MVSVDDLKPCVCGNAPRAGTMGDEDGGYGFVECHSGHSIAVHCDTEEEARRDWNALTTLQSRVIELEEALGLRITLSNTANSGGIAK